MGQHILVDPNPQTAEIVGIVADVRQSGLDAAARPGIFRPCNQDPLQSAMLALRTKGDPLQFVNAVRGKVSSVDRDQPVSAVKTMEDVMEASRGQRRFLMTLLGIFAGLAVLLAVIGMYGLIAYSVAQRTKEIGIRKALGAQQTEILSLVLRRGLGRTAVGIGVGLWGAFMLTHVLKNRYLESAPPTRRPSSASRCYSSWRHWW